jgi:hypothetical protein
MSNKKWRNPANADSKTGVDTSIPEQQQQPQQPTKPSPEVVAEAQKHLSPPEPGTDRYAVQMLLRTADFLDEFVQEARAVLKMIPREKVKAILDQAEQPPAHASPQKRPRGATHPILLLHRLAVSASRMLERVLKATNPSLFTTSPEKANLLALARQSGDFVRRLEQRKAEEILAAAAA